MNMNLLSEYIYRIASLVGLKGRTVFVVQNTVFKMH